MQKHIYHELFQYTLFELPSSLFVAGNDLFIKQADDEYLLLCKCGHHPKQHRKEKKCSYCGNELLEICDTLCLRGVLEKEDGGESYKQVLYFFRFHCTKEHTSLILERVGEVCFSIWNHHVTYKEYSATQEIASLVINMAEKQFYEQTNTFSALQRGFIPLESFDFGAQWSYGRSKINSNLYADIPLHVQLIIEFILLSEKEKLFPISQKNISIFMIYFFYLQQRKNPYLKPISTPLIHTKDVNFYQLFQHCTSLDTFVGKAIFQNKASKTIKRWFYEKLNSHEQQKTVFLLDYILVLVKIFTNKDLLLRSLYLFGKNQRLAENICEATDLLLFLAEKKGEKWLLNQMSKESFYTNDFADIICIFNLHYDLIKHRKLPRIKTLNDVMNVIDLSILEEDQRNEVFSLDPFPYKEFHYSLEGEYAGYSFRLPKSPKELCEWGQKQKNCLTAFHHNITEQSSIILGVFQNNLHQYTLQLTLSGEILEAKAKRNHPIPRNILDIIEQYLHKNNH